MNDMDYYTAIAFGFIGMLFGILTHGWILNTFLIGASIMIALALLFILTQSEALSAIGLVMIAVVFGPFTAGMLTGATIDLIHHSREMQHEHNPPIIQSGVCVPPDYYIIPSRPLPSKSITHTI